MPENSSEKIDWIYTYIKMDATIFYGMCFMGLIVLLIILKVINNSINGKDDFDGLIWNTFRSLY